MNAYLDINLHINSTNLNAFFLFLFFLGQLQCDVYSYGIILLEMMTRKTY
jgi:hypothetical protein